MAEKKKPFEDEFSTDEFDAFDSDDFNFDDDDEDPFQLDISEGDTENIDEEEDDDSSYHFSEDETEEHEEEGLESSEIEQSSQQDKFNPTVFIQNLIERLKNEEPKQLIKYGIGAFIVLLFLIGGLIKLLSPAPTAAKTTTSQTSSTLNQPNNLQQNPNIPTLSQNSSPPAGFSTTSNLSGSMPTTTQNSSNSLESLNNPTPVAPVPPPSTTQTSALSTAPAVVNPAEMQQAATQNSTLTNHINQLDAQVAQLTQQVTIDAQMNASNQAQIASLIKSIDSMQSQMAKVNNAMQTIVSAVGQTNNRQSGFVAGGNTFNNNTSVQTAPDYYVQAVIPGRAWLKSSNGQIITVTTGDAVPGYGTVETIDSQSGVVTTSTGTKIMFGIDEG
ncbi:MAG: hypothetical protein HKM04_03220 [Legionellales bacterium]|nr:hypothetical protein [Legionellales bacterium]